MNKVTKQIICASLAAIAIAGIITPLLIFYLPHQVTLNSSTLEIVNGSIARLANDYKCSFKIKDDVIATRYMDNINVFSVKVNGNKIPPEDYSFIYQTNQKNEFTINKSYLKGNIEINADLVSRTQKHNCYYLGYYLEDECGLDFDNMEILYPTKVGDKNAMDPKTKDINDIYIKDGYDAVRLEKGDHPLDLNFPSIIVREDNTLKLKFKAKQGTTLPKNIWFNTNARFALKGEDFNIEYSADNKEAIMTMPYFVIRDSGFLQLKPDEGIKHE